MYQSLTFLRSEGLLIVKGTSCYARYPVIRIPYSPLFDKFLLKQGLTPVTDNLIEPEIISAPADIAESLKKFSDDKPAILSERFCAM